MNSKARHLARLAKSKSYIVITDDDAVISIKDVDPRKLEDKVRITSQLIYLKKYRTKLTQVIKIFEGYIAADFGVENSKSGRKTTKK